MRASKLLAAMDEQIAAMREQCEIGLPSLLYFRDLARCLARLEAAVEQLARDAGTGPARRIKEILDNETEGRT